MCEENKQPEVCKNSFTVLFEKIDGIDKAIRGNGRVGIQTRLDRLEQFAGLRSKLLWLMAGIVLTGLFGFAFSLITITK